MLCPRQFVPDFIRNGYFYLSSLLFGFMGVVVTDMRFSFFFFFLFFAFRKYRLKLLSNISYMYTVHGLQQKALGLVNIFCELNFRVSFLKKKILKYNYLKKSRNAVSQYPKKVTVHLMKYSEQ